MKKPNKIYNQKFDVKQENLFKLQALEQSDDGNCSIILLLQCLQEQDSLKQAALLKKISIAVNKSILSDDDKRFNTCLEVLAEMFVIVDYKNPARRTLISLFDNLPVSLHSFAIQCIRLAILEKLEEKAHQITITQCNLRPAIDMVSSLMENFQLGNQVIKSNGLQVLGYLYTYLQHLIHNARCLTNSVEITITMNDCLAATKAIIAVLQKCCRKTREEKRDTFLSDVWINQLKAIAAELVLILKNDFLPDCQTASGMGLCLIISLASQQQTINQMVLQTIFPHYLVPQHTEQHWISTLMAQQTWKVPTSFAHLCLCHGVLTMIPLEDLISPLESFELLQGSLNFSTLLFDIIFKDLCLLCESLKEPFSCLTSFKVLTLWTEQARCAIILDDIPECLSAQVIGSGVIPNKLLSFVWNYWDHPIEMVRYQTKAIFEHVVKMHVTVSSHAPAVDTFLKDLTGSLMKVGWHNRGIYGPLCCMSSITGAKCLLSWYPSIPNQVMGVLNDRITGPHVIDFIDAISKNHKQEIISSGQEMSDWLKTWILPIINLLLYEDGTQDGMHIVQSLSKLLKCHPASLHFIIQNLQDQHVKSVPVLITCLKTARSLGLIKVNDLDESTLSEEATWGGVVPVDWLKKALCHIQEQTRLDALGLLCDSSRTTEPISMTDLKLLRVFMPLNMNNQSPSFRQQCSAHLKKLLLRMKESLRISAKKLDKSKDNHLNTQILNSCKEFLHWFSNLLFSSLFPGASFARRTTALHLLKLISSIYADNEGPKREPFIFSDVMSTTNVKVLVECLCDDYDVNKVLAYELLVCCPADILPFQNPNTLQNWLQRIECLLSSPKAVDSSTASITLKLLVDKCSFGLYLPSEIQYELNEACTLDPLGVECQVLRVLCYLLEVLKSQRAVAEVSLNQASSQAPMHGLLYCLRMMLCHLSLSQFSSNLSWQQLISRLLDECLHVAELVSPVVTSSSPEGHMINDEEEDDFDNSLVFNTSSQILLVCCWRTMKEVALLLGDLVQKAPIKKAVTGLLTSKQVHRIGEFFTTVLLTSKHHGAFELAYNGFVKLCSMLWMCNDDTLRLLPRQWLDSLISDISKCVPTEVLCGTRRSAGVPFFVQAIVTTEPQPSGKSTFKQLTTDLLAIASQPIDKEIPKDSTLPQVHARNILRALFRDTRLGEDVFPYVADGLQVAISGFLSDSWAIRNSSTLLFSALMTRIFGVKKSKDEHSKRNCMNGREFFTRFPELHPFLQEQLRQSTEAFKNSLALDLHPSLYPVLVLLSRLYPSTLDGADSTLSMSAFVPYVIRCGSSSVLKTRAMAARAIVPLVTGETMATTLQHLIRSLPSSSSKVKQNKMHGALLQIQHIVHEHLVQSTPSDRIKDLVTNTILPMLEPFHWIASRLNPCEVTRAVFLDIILNIVGIPNLRDKEQNLPNVLHTLKVITHTALQELTTKDVAKPLIPVGQTLVKEVCARILLSSMNRDLEAKMVGRDSFPRFSTKRLENDKKELPNELVPLNHHEVFRYLLASNHYEVRLITLQHLNANLSRSHFSSRNVLSRTVMKKENDDRTEEEDVKFLFSKEDLNQLSTVILEMAIYKEQHLDCLEQIYQVLSCVVDSISFPQIFSSGKTISLFECWKHALQVCKSSEQRDSSLHCALLDFLASTTDSIYQALMSSEDAPTKCTLLDSLHVFSSLLKCFSNEDKSFDVRLQTAQILSSGKLNTFVWDPHKLLGDLPFDIWGVVLKLLHDDDPCVRDCVAQITGRSDSDTTGPVPPLATTSILRSVCNHFYPRQPRVTLQWMLGWITSCDTIPTTVTKSKVGLSNQNSEMDVLFEKNSLNSYQEKLIIVQSVAQVLRDLSWLISKTEPHDVLDEPSDVIDDVTRNALHWLQQVQKENGFDLSELFIIVYCNVMALVMTGILRKRIYAYKQLGPPQSFSNLSISSNQESKVIENVSSYVKDLYLKLSLDVRFRDIVHHPLTRSCLQEFCEIHGVPSFSKERSL